MKNKIIDLRSDTVTLPTAEMREKMAGAAVGDDVFGEDPTVNRLEQEGAALVGKEAAIFLPSGTMGNLVAVLNHTSRGDAVLLDKESHIFCYEAGGSSLAGGVQLWPMRGLHHGAVLKIKEAVRPSNIHFAPARLLCLENTHNRQGGTVMLPEEHKKIYHTASGLGLSVHLDGARIFNAAAALNCPVTDFTRWCDSVMFCLSKGLGAPAGSLLAGSASFIEKARRNRKLLGGGMRQSGILAAAGLIALEHRHALSEDHRRANDLASGLSALAGLVVDQPPTNILIVHTIKTGLSPGEFCNRLAEKNIKILPLDETSVRMVTHRDIGDNDLEEVINAAKTIVQNNSQNSNV